MDIFKRLVIVLMFFSFLLAAGTGVIKLPETQQYFLFVYDYTSASNLSMVHDWGNVVFIVLVLIHIFLKRSRLMAAFSTGYQIPEKVSKAIYVLIGVALVALAVVYVNANYFNRERKPIDLSGVEVKEYKGEKLGSINDFRQNAISGTQYIEKKDYVLEITGLVDRGARYKYEDVLKLQSYQKVVQLNCVEGWSVKALWEGILVRDLIKDLGMKPEAKTIIFYAVDGYSTSFPVEYIMNNDIIMAYNLNGVELPPERGFPFQLVAEDKWGYKWIRWITKVELSDNVDYKGFWEKNGYNNVGDLSGSKFENR